MARNSKKILFIQHAHLLGGSVVSLKELLLNAKAEYECIVICPNLTIKNYYERFGIKASIIPLASFSHNTAYWYKFSILDVLRLFKVILLSIVSIIKLCNVIRQHKPDIIHLNSSTLIFYLLPLKLIFPKIKRVIHIRENVVHGYKGIRQQFIKYILNKYANAIIYISEVEASILRTKDSISHIIYNYINEQSVLTTLDFEGLNLITMGGLFKLKGGDVLLEAIENTTTNVKLVVLGSFDIENSEEQANEIIKIDGIKYYKKIEELIKKLKVRDKIIFAGKVDNPLVFLNSVQALIFWTLSPHFPRPVYEAWFLDKPVIYFNKGFNSIDINNETVLELATSGPTELSKRIDELFQNYEYYKTKFICNKNIADSKFSGKNYSKIRQIYNAEA